MKLTHQYESECDPHNRAFGFEVFEDPAEGYATYRMHVRWYDGIRVAASWRSDETRAETTAAAVAAARASLPSLRHEFRNAP